LTSTGRQRGGDGVRHRRAGPDRNVSEKLKSELLVDEELEEDGKGTAVSEEDMSPDSWRKVA
jgi:hypothetical protein